MRLSHRTSVGPDAVLATADAFFGALGMRPGVIGPRDRDFAGPLGQLRLAVRMEGGHYTFVEAHTDQVGESRLDKNVKKFFTTLHRQADPGHKLSETHW
jgi:hypothetical protein